MDFVGCILLMMVYGTKINNSNLINITFFVTWHYNKSKKAKTTFVSIAILYIYICINV